MRKSPVVEEWLAKARSDLLAAETLARRGRRPLPNQVGFFCQQSAEKMLKAFILSCGHNPPFTHDLMELANKAASLDSQLTPLCDWVEGLTDFAVEYRYPGADATAEEARNALKRARRIFKYLANLMQ